MTTRIRAARGELGWSQVRLIAELERVAQRREVTLPGRETLQSRVSRWENGHSKPDEFYRQLLREALGMDDRELGLDSAPYDPAAGAAGELRAHLSIGRQVDGALLAALGSQTDSIRVQDRQYGAGLLLEQLRGHVRNLEVHLTHTVFEGARRPLAQVLADAAALAGWQALDVGGLDQAWRSFETATSASRQAGDMALYAFARLEQAHVLADMSQYRTAADLAESVWRDAESVVARSVRCWMAAATAEMYAVDGRRHEAVGMLARAEVDAAALATGESPPYLVFSGTHLDRWIGHTLVLLKDPSAESRLRRASASMDASFKRASASLSFDLATAVLQRGEKAEARVLISEGESLARQVGSRRQLRRGQELRAVS